MTSKEFEKLISSYKSECKKSGKERPLTDEEFNRIGSSLENIPNDYRRYFDMAHGGDFSKFEKLPLLLRNFLGESQIRLFHRAYGKNPSLENPDVQKYLKGFRVKDIGYKYRDKTVCIGAITEDALLSALELFFDDVAVYSDKEFFMNNGTEKLIKGEYSVGEIKLNGFSLSPFPSWEGEDGNTSTIDYKMVKKNRKPFYKKLPTVIYKSYIAITRLLHFGK